MTSEQEQKAEDEGIVGQSASTAGLGVEEIMDMVDAVCDATLNAFGNDRMSINIADGFVAKIKRDELRAALALSLKAPNA